MLHLNKNLNFMKYSITISVPKDTGQSPKDTGQAPGRMGLAPPLIIDLKYVPRYNYNYLFIYLLYC